MKHRRGLVFLSLLVIGLYFSTHAQTVSARIPYAATTKTIPLTWGEFKAILDSVRLEETASNTKDTVLDTLRVIAVSESLAHDAKILESIARTRGRFAGKPHETLEDYHARRVQKQGRIPVTPDFAVFYFTTLKRWEKDLRISSGSRQKWERRFAREKERLDWYPHPKLKEWAKNALRTQGHVLP